MNSYPKWRISRDVVIALIVWAGAAMFANAQTGSTNSDHPWDATTQDSASNTNPSRTTETHTKSGNRMLDKKTVEVRGPDGQYQPYADVETETVQENVTTTRTITRTYNAGLDGRKQVSQVTEVETKDSGDGGSRSVETTSHPDADGTLHVVEREITTRKKSGESQDAQTTIYLPDISGNFAPSMQVNEQQTKASDGSLDSRKTTLLPDANGGWQVYEVRNQKVEGTAQDQTTEVTTSRRDFEGNVSPVSQVIAKETKVDGQVKTTSDTYSVDIPGSARDQTLHPIERSKTLRRAEPGRTITEQQVQELGSASVSLGTSTMATDIVIVGSSGTQETNTITVQYPEGYPSVVSVKTRASNQAPVVQVQAEPSDKP